MTKDKTFRFRIAGQDLDVLIELAEKRGVTPSQLIRDLIHKCAKKR